MAASPGVDHGVRGQRGSVGAGGAPHLRVRLRRARLQRGTLEELRAPD